MGMRLGDSVRVPLFGESHGKCVGALVEGIPAGTESDLQALNEDIARRKPGRKGLSMRSESDECEILSGVHEGKATGWPILLLTWNSNAKSKDYSFLPDQPRPDMLTFLKWSVQMVQPTCVEEALNRLD